MKIIPNKFDENKGIVLLENQRLFYKLNGHDAVELIVKRIADDVGINCASYTLVKHHGIEYCVSPDIGESFKTAEELGIVGHKLCEIKRGLENRYPNDVDRLYYEIVKLYIFDILLLNFDRTELNWGILDKNGRPELYIFDNECAFTIGSCYISCRESKPYEQIKINNDLVEIPAFLEMATPEEIELLRSMYDRFTPQYISVAIDEVEKKIGREVTRKDTLLQVYKRHYIELGELIKQPTLKF